MIEVRHNHWKREPLPLSYFDQSTRDWYFQRIKWIQDRDEYLERLRWDACQKVQGGVYRYFNHCWTHMHPWWDWPDWWAEQSDRLEWLHRQYAIKTGNIRPFPWRDQQWCGSPIDPIVLMWASGALMQGVLLVAKTDGTELPANGDYVLDPNDQSTIASDSNDGILGSGGPWLGAQKGFSELSAGTVAGAKYWIRGGGTTYWEATDTIATNLSWGDFGANPGGAEASNTHIIGWPGDSPRPRLSNERTGFGDLCLTIGQDSDSITGFQMRHIDFATRINLIQIGNNASGGATDTEFKDIKRYFNSGGGGSDNGSPIKIEVPGAGSQTGNVLIEAYETIEPAATNGGNNAEQYYIGIGPGSIFRNNTFIHESSGSSTNTIYHKRQDVFGATPTQGDLTIRNNYIGYIGSTSSRGLFNGGNNRYTDLINNLWPIDLAGNVLAWFTSVDTGTPDHDCYNMRWLHNTWSNLQTNGMRLLLIHRDAAGATQAIDNTVQDNLFHNAQFQIENDTANPGEYDHNTTMDYNHFQDNATLDMVRMYRNDTDDTTYATLSAFTGNTSPNEDIYYAGGDHDANSVSETVNFAGTPAIGNIGSYALDGASAGSGTASDSTDMGADVDLVGPAALGY